MPKTNLSIQKIQSYICSILIFLIYLLLTTSILAQTPDIKWAKKAGSTSWDMGYSIVTDTEGNTYITGDFTGGVQFGSTMLVSTAMRDIFVAKLDSNGNYLWATRAGGYHNDVGHGIALDKQGNCYVVGECTGDSDFQSHQFDDIYSADYGFLAKYSPDGVALMVYLKKQWYPWAVAVDKDGNPVTNGNFKGPITIGNKTYQSEGTTDLIITKFYGSTLSPVWAVPGNVRYEQWGYGICTDDLGNILATGSYNDRIIFGNNTKYGLGRHVFLVKLNTNGIVQWLQVGGSQGDDDGYDVVVDGARNAYITGSFEQTATFSGEGANYESVTSAGFTDGFIAKYNSDGAVVWVKRFGGAQNHDRGWGIDIDNDNRIFLAGFFGDQADFGSYTLEANGGSWDTFVAQINPLGTFKWVVGDGTSDSDYARDVSTDSHGNAYATGGFNGSSSYGDDYLSSNGGFDILTLRVGDTPLVKEAWWTDEVDVDNDGYKSSAKLHWKMSINGTGTFTFITLVAKTITGLSSWTNVGTVSQQIQLPGFFQGKMTVPGSGHRYYDFKISFFTGTGDLITAMDGEDDTDLVNYKMETEVQDEPLEVYISDYSDFPAYPYNTNDYRQGGAFVGCGPTTGAMIFGYFDHTFDSNLLHNPSSGVNEGLNTAWLLHSSTYMNTLDNGFGYVWDIEPGLEDYAEDKGESVEVMIHVGTDYDPNSEDADWLNDYGPYGSSWNNDGDFWVHNQTNDTWSFDVEKFCDFVKPQLLQGIPIFLTIDTDMNKEGDHWVPLVGFNRTNERYYYYDTYSTTLRSGPIHYCGAPGTAQDNAISFVRSVSYTGPGEEQVIPPPSLAALSNYDHAVPVAWKAPNLGFSGSMNKYIENIPPDVNEQNSISSQSYIKPIIEAEPRFMKKLERNLHRTAESTVTYNVYRSTSSGGSYTKVSNSQNRTYYRDESVNNGQTYYYKVTTVSNSTESDYSSTVNATPTANGYQVSLGWATPVPIIDGELSTEEWSNAGSCDITYPGKSGTVTMYVMNDENYLYLAVDDPTDNNLNKYDGIGLFFDENINRAWPGSANGTEGMMRVYYENGEATAWFSGFSGTWPSVSGQNWSSASGVEAAISASSGHLQYEVRFDLSTSPINPSGLTLGWSIYIFEGGSSSFTALWPQELVNKLKGTWANYIWAHGPFSYGDLIFTDEQPTQGHWADIDGDGDVDAIDIQLVAACWNTEVGDAEYKAECDVDNDGDVDAIDIQLVAGWWNKDISGD